MANVLRYMLALKPLLAIVGLCLPLLVVAAQGKPDRLFAAQDMIEITLTAPFRSIARDRDEAPEDRPATLSYPGEHGPQSVAIGIRVRGKSRRVRDVCTFPPLRLNLPKARLKGTLFAKQDKLKLVTHCKSNAAHQQVLLREYLAYRMLNVLTDTSFKVRLLRVNYVDEDRGGRITTRLGFLIEHKDRLAKRLATQLIDTPRVDRQALAPAATSLAELYQLMISNTDFSFVGGPASDRCCHNTVLLAGVGGQVIPIPYDFDVSGLVNAPYALPPDGLGQRNVRDRRYRGFCRAESYLDGAVDTLHAKRATMYALIADIDELNENNQRQVTRFIEGFYKTLDDPKSYQRDIVDACRG